MRIYHFRPDAGESKPQARSLANGRRRQVFCHRRLRMFDALERPENLVKRDKIDEILRDPPFVASLRWNGFTCFAFYDLDSKSPRVIKLPALRAEAGEATEVGIDELDMYDCCAYIETS